MLLCGGFCNPQVPEVVLKPESKVAELEDVPPPTATYYLPESVISRQVLLNRCVRVWHHMLPVQL